MEEGFGLEDFLTIFFVILFNNNGNANHSNDSVDYFVSASRELVLTLFWAFFL